VKKALITGVTGQDGSHLAELLIEKGYDVHGLVRRSSVLTRSRIDHLFGHDLLTLHYGDLTDSGSLRHLVEAVQPDEVYNLAAMSHVGVSFEMPEFTASTNAGGTRRLLGALEETGVDARFYQASSSEIFGSSPTPHDESSPYHPRNPYGDSKLEAHLAVVKRREMGGMYAVCGIAFNHESPRRGENFVTRKITKAVAAIEAGIRDRLTLGKLDAVRDWGFAPEYVEAMWRMLQADEPEDYVLATGEGHSVRDFVETAFAHAGLDWQEHVEFDESLTRPNEVDTMVGQPAEIERRLGWTARTKALDVARLMVDADRQEIRRFLGS
jgi:GDPmannose 4,6-dehydratase